MRRPVAFDPNNLNRNKGRRRGKVSVDVDSANLTGSLTFYNTPEPPDNGYIIVSDSNTVKGIAAGSAKPVFWTADDSTIVSIVNGLPGNTTTVSTVAGAFSYLASSGNYFVISPKNENIISNGLVLELDASNKMSINGSSGALWYNLAEGGANVVATSANGPTYSTSEEAVYFDGTNDYYYDDSITLPSGTKTVICFIKPTANMGTDSYKGLVSWGNRSTTTPSSHLLLSLRTSGATIHVSSAYWGNDWVPNLNTVTADKWNMVGIIARQQTSTNNTTLFRYNSGGYSSSTGSSSSYSKNINTNSINLRIGCTDLAGRYFNGHIKKVLVYDRELSETEIKQVYYGAPIVINSSLKTVIDAKNPVCELNSTTISEITGNGNDFTTEDTVTRTTDYGGVYHLNSGRIYRSSVSWYGKMAISWWMKYNGAISGGNFYTESNRGPSGCARIYSPINSNGTFTFRVWDNSSGDLSGGRSRYVTTTTNVCDGKWHQITGQWSNGSGNQPRGLYIYVDGNKEAYMDMVGNDGSYAHWHLGGSYGCQGTKTHNCYLGPILQYNNYNLTDAEVLQNYNAYKSRFK